MVGWARLPSFDLFKLPEGTRRIRSAIRAQRKGDRSHARRGGRKARFPEEKR